MHSLVPLFARQWVACSHCCHKLCVCWTLQAVVGNQQVDHSARWLAAVQLKNSVNKHWRPRYDRGWVLPAVSTHVDRLAASLRCSRHAHGASGSQVLMQLLHPLLAVCAAGACQLRRRRTSGAASCS